MVDHERKHRPHISKPDFHGKTHPDLHGHSPHIPGHKSQASSSEATKSHHGKRHREEQEEDQCDVIACNIVGNSESGKDDFFSHTTSVNFWEGAPEQHASGEYWTYKRFIWQKEKRYEVRLDNIREKGIGDPENEAERLNLEQRRAEVIVICFNPSIHKSFSKNIQMWVNEALEIDQNTRGILLALRPEGNKTISKMGKEMAGKINAVYKELDVHCGPGDALELLRKIVDLAQASNHSPLMKLTDHV